MDQDGHLRVSHHDKPFYWGSTETVLVQHVPPPESYLIKLFLLLVCYNAGHGALTQFYTSVSPKAEIQEER